MKKLTQEELLHQLDEMTGRRYMDFPWSVKDRQAYDQLKEIVKLWYKFNLWDLRVGVLDD